jgi:hypothetical protein
MHLSFIIYGERRAVEKTLREMEAQKYFLKFKSLDGKDNRKGVYIEGHVRELPLGVKEIIFPKEDLNLVLSTIGEECTHYFSKAKQIMLRNLLGYKAIPKFKKGNGFLWQKENTAIIPLGIKEDKLIFDEKIKEWHEGL